MTELFDLFTRFTLLGAIAFGGSGASLPLIEHIAVSEMEWLTPRQFAVGTAFAYATPGPLMVLATFIGFHVAGAPGALVATLSVFAAPCLLAAGAAGVVRRLSLFARFRSFGTYAGTAAIGLLSVTAANLAGAVVHIHPALLAGALAVLLGEHRGLSPAILIVMAACVGGVAGAFMG